MANETPPPASNKPGVSAESLEHMMDIPVEVTVELGSTRLPLREVVNMAPGSVIELDRKADDPVSLYVNGKLVAQGEVVLVENNLGIKISRLHGVQ